MTDFRRPATVERAVLEELRQMIVTGHLRPGESIPQDSLASQLKVSKVPIREALKLLEGEGLVSYRPHRGYTVISLDVEDLAEIYRMRQLLEEEAIRDSIETLSESDLSVMERAMLAFENTLDDLASMTEANRRFHFTLLESAQRPRLLRTIRILWDASDAYRFIYYTSSSALETVCEEHRAIFEAVSVQDLDETLHQLQIHRQSAVSTLRDTLLADPVQES